MNCKLEYFAIECLEKGFSEITAWTILPDAVFLKEVYLKLYLKWTA